MKNAIIIFIRNPELGKVKTRLAKEIGEEQALQVYTELLLHTNTVVKEVACDRFVFYTDYINSHDIWELGKFEKRLQEGEELGGRMLASFFQLFQQGYSKVVIVGSDCPELSAYIIEEAFSGLNYNDVVIGPTPDGGYYLLGLTSLLPELFNNKQWSTSTVLTDTIKDTVRLKKSYSLLKELSDIDTADDLHRHKNKY